MSDLDKMKDVMRLLATGPTPQDATRVIAEIRKIVGAAERAPTPPATEPVEPARIEKHGRDRMEKSGRDR